MGDVDLSWYKDCDDLQISLDPDAKAALFVGYPVHSGLLDSHDIKIGAFIAESERLPQMWAQCADRTDLVVVPSDWLRDVFIEHGVAEAKTLTVPHGLDRAYYMTPPKRSPKMDVGTRFLHISGARDFPWRKGTPQLIEAFKLLFREGGPYGALKAKLLIRTPEAEWLREAIGNYKELFILDISEDALPPRKMMMHTYCNHIFALVQPSAAEAFGICPLEARALGIPVICTHCTGHKQHASHTDTVVKHGASVDMRVNGIPNGKAPEVTTEEIVKAFIRFMNLQREITKSQRWSTAYMQPEGYLESYTWKNVTRTLAERIKEML